MLIKKRISVFVEIYFIMNSFFIQYITPLDIYVNVTQEMFLKGDFRIQSISVPFQHLRGKDCFGNDT